MASSASAAVPTISRPTCLDRSLTIERRMLSSSSATRTRIGAVAPESGPSLMTMRRPSRLRCLPHECHRPVSHLASLRAALSDFDSAFRTWSSTPNPVSAVDGASLRLERRGVELLEGHRRCGIAQGTIRVGPPLHQGAALWNSGCTTARMQIRSPRTRSKAGVMRTRTISWLLAGLAVSVGVLAAAPATVGTPRLTSGARA
jgi:hypothetical protein